MDVRLPRQSPALRPARPAAGLLAGWLALCLAWTPFFSRGADAPPEAVIVSLVGTAEIARGGSTVWSPATAQQWLFPGDVLRTHEFSRAAIRFQNASVLQVRELSTLRLEPRDELPILRLLRGAIFFFHRDKPAGVEVRGGTVNAAILGTEFAFAVAEDDTVSVALYDGTLRLSNPAGQTQLASLEAAVIPPNAPPQRTATLLRNDWSAVQWALAYPAILDPAELGWDAAPDPVLGPSLEAWRRGHLPDALRLYPADRTPATPAERLYRAALLLTVGSVEAAQPLLAGPFDDPRLERIAAAHRELIEAVLHRRGPAGPDLPATPLAAELLARAYALQAVFQLADARDAAAQATVVAPDFGAAWTRLAELEFSLGRSVEARAALQRAREVSPENAAARALLGFTEAAANRLNRARERFEEAIAIDPSLPDARLGLGLARIRQGDLGAGREELILAAALEPQRSLLRSYLAKAFADSTPWRDTADPDRARHELGLARELDPQDPTPWLYSALLNEQENRLNDAVDDLAESQARNDARALYRSRLGLDQDRAVRSANLARIFSDVGFHDIGFREATRAVNADYTNPSAHLFLANSYQALRDPRQIHLRYETAWYTEYLVANLLAPVGAGSLSPTVAQNEYSRLFERDRLGLSSTTTWTSNGDWLEQAAHTGQSGNLAYALDVDYRSLLGERPNQDFEQLAASATAKIQAGARDSFLVQATYAEAESGDVLQRHDLTRAIQGLRLEEHHEPLGLVGWQHEWQPGVHTLALVAPWNASFAYVNPSNAVPYVVDFGNLGRTAAFSTVPLSDYTSQLTGVSAELQQLWQTGDHTLVAGTRFQHGDFDVTARLEVSDFDPAVPAQSSADPSMQRVTVYAYDQWQLCSFALLTAGLAYDDLTLPANFRTAPVSSETDDVARLLPKVGLTIQPWEHGVLRGAWTRSLTGVSLDQSVRLEPVQVAGFNQTFRTLIPESIAGSVAGQDLETWGVAFDQSFDTRTWVTLAMEWVSSEADREHGGFAYSTSGFAGTQSFAEELEFQERSLSATVGQLVARDVSLVARYRWSRAELEQSFPAFASEPGFSGDQAADLHQLTFGARYHGPSGLFALWETRWTRQSNEGDAAGYEGDDFWQHDVWVGWRFWQRRAEIAAGLLNLTGQDYRLHPLNFYPETYRDRTFTVTGRFAF